MLPVLFVVNLQTHSFVRERRQCSLINRSETPPPNCQYSFTVGWGQIAKFKACSISSYMVLHEQCNLWTSTTKSIQQSDSLHSTLNSAVQGVYYSLLTTHYISLIRQCLQIVATKLVTLSEINATIKIIGMAHEPLYK